MNNELQIKQQTSVSERLAEKYGTDKARFYNIVKTTCKMEKATNEQFEAFLMMAEKYDLNPIMKQMWAYPDRNGGIMTMVSLDGWITIVNSRPEYDGYETRVQLDDKGKPISATCTMWRKDRSRPTTKTIYTSEWSKSTSPVWQSMPIHFIEMRAFIQCARMCFNISGINDDEVMPLDLSAKYQETITLEYGKENAPTKFKPKLAPEQFEPVDITDLCDDLVDNNIPQDILNQAENLFKEEN